MSSAPPRSARPLPIAATPSEAPLRILPILAALTLASALAPAWAGGKVYTVAAFLADRNELDDTSVRVHGLTYCPSEAACVLTDNDGPTPAHSISYSCSMLPEADRLALFKSGSGAAIRTATVTLRGGEAERLEFDH